MPLYDAFPVPLVLLAFLLWQPDAILTAAKTVVPADFPTRSSAELFGLLVARRRLRRSVDVVVLRHELRAQGSPLSSIVDAAAAVPWTCLHAAGSLRTIIAAFHEDRRAQVRRAQRRSA